ncbi:MAG: DUF4249 family protein [Cryomorphaceae bacterium]|nr:DUF4249 domain-containing protein [Flavobacteriales bacterium]
MKRFNLFHFTLGVLGMLMLSGCAKDDYSEENDISKKLVVEAYVYAGEPINHVKISKVHNEGDASPVPVETANVRVFQDDLEFTLTPHPEIPGRYIQSDTSMLPLAYGESKLRISYQGRTHMANSAMPESISNLEVSAETITVTPDDTETTLAEITWNPVENAAGYCIFIRNQSENATPIGNANYGEPSENPFLIVNHNHKVELKSSHFTHFGEYEIYVTAVNEEYARIYESNNSGSFASAPSNIENGWGVFTNFNGKTKTIVVQ